MRCIILIQRSLAISQMIFFHQPWSKPEITVHVLIQGSAKKTYWHLAYSSPERSAAIRNTESTAYTVEYWNGIMKKLFSYISDESRTEPQTTTTPLPFTVSTTPVYIPEGLGGRTSEKSPIFAPRNTYDYPKVNKICAIYNISQVLCFLPENSVG